MVTRVPVGGYTEGYDAGLRDAKEGRERAVKRLRRRPSVSGSGWATYRMGYDDGYFDGQIVVARRTEP